MPERFSSLQKQNNICKEFDAVDRPNQCTQEVLIEQLLWLIQLRWIAVVGVVTATLVGNYIFPFPVLMTPVPIYVCAGALLLCNIFYYLVTTPKGSGVGSRDIVLGTVQVEADLVILTAVLHFSGGLLTHFFFFMYFMSS